MELERAMSENRKRLPVADQIRKGLEEAIRHARGEITLKTTMVEIPEPPPEIQPEELAKLRLDNRMSQDVFARVLNVPTRSVRSWEEGKGRPSRAALRLIQVFRQNTAGVLEVVGMTAGRELAGPRRRPHRARSKKGTPPRLMT
jgi:putative transcriptional regulator